MSSIPPNWLGSIIQGHASADRAKESKAREATADAERVKPSAFADKLNGAIQATDRDSNVFEDAEGSGGGGRASSQGEHDADEDQLTPHNDDTDKNRLDVQV